MARWDRKKEVKMEDLVGETLTSVEAVRHGEIVKLATQSGRKFEMYHDQDCCESVWLEDICGELDDLIGSPLVQASEDTPDLPDLNQGNSYVDDSWTWTFYTLQTVKGTVVLRWYGTSNGYYSESVDLVEV